jgi:hypothetical protein
MFQIVLAGRAGHNQVVLASFGFAQNLQRGIAFGGRWAVGMGSLGRRLRGTDTTHSSFNTAATVFNSFSAVYGFGRKVFTP